MIETRERVSLIGEKGALRAKGLSSNEPQDQSTSRVSNAEAHTSSANSTNNSLKPLENLTNNSYPNP